MAVPAYNSHNLIRLHVIANSDTAADQELKRHVRDAILASVGRSLAAAGDIGAARKMVSYDLAAITAAARAQIKRSGQDYPVRTEFGDFPFPTRAYGDIILPAGEYEAVRLVIGEGKGQNWWCVLFPPLCLVDVAGKNGDTLSPPVMGGEGPARPRLAWKIVEIFKSSRQRLAGL
ncbi:MAG: stage II sporulation protein R [Moorella sp. (in: Bacteria)]|nr:stage II sporulation protein R [Moorella sp. (in: firmicutes)]